jgi:hypothetical protein
MLRSIIAFFYSYLFISLRRHVFVSNITNTRVYEHVYGVPTTDIQIKIKISESLFIVNYGKWAFFRLKRKLYKAELVELTAGITKNTYTAHYPPLSTGFYLDPLYPLAIIAYTHLDEYITKELKYGN